ncbi:MAG: SDR family oxidoreductase [Actinobacteria bacterium]|nr:SDR family oxidoreductase [Actinomycetota bacterium]
MTSGVVVVTGGSQGIGRATVEACLRGGSAVVSLDLVEGGPPSEVGEFVHISCDVTDEGRVASAMADLAERFDVIDGLVNNAGANVFEDPATMEIADWDRLFALDLRASWLCAKHAYPLLLRSNRASIVNVSSIHAKLTVPGMFPYAAAKSGLEGLTRSLALEWGDRGIRVNAVAPGFTRTQLVIDWLAMQQDPVAAVERLNSQIALGRMSEPSEIASVIAFLLGSESSAMTGAVVPVDGGHSIRYPS